jgi:cyclopropane fatty-acyl-phospholipid synthase-like methyltransferase
MSKPFAESCAENRAPILAVLEPRLRDSARLLEIGSGTGQHAAYFAAQLPWLVWQTSDVAAQHPGIMAWLEDSALPNTRAPLNLDVLTDDWPSGPYDAVFSANTAHIMPVAAVEAMFQGSGRVLRPEGRCLLYGPFSYDGRHTAPSNERFDAWLKARDPQMGIRDLAWLSEIADAAGMELVEDVEMPVNNRMLVWRKRSQFAGER